MDIIKVLDEVYYENFKLFANGWSFDRSNLRRIHTDVDAWDRLGFFCFDYRRAN